VATQSGNRAKAIEAPQRNYVADLSGLHILDTLPARVRLLHPGTSGVNLLGDPGADCIGCHSIDAQCDEAAAPRLVANRDIDNAKSRVRFSRLSAGTHDGRCQGPRRNTVGRPPMSTSGRSFASSGTDFRDPAQPWQLMASSRHRALSFVP